MYYTIYKTTNNINGKIYVGKHQTEEINDSYIGSGVMLKKAIKKYGKDNFTKEVLFVFNNEEEMNEKEIELLSEEFVSRKDTYNIGVGGEGGAHFLGKKHTCETKKKIADAFRNRKLLEDTKRKISESGKGIKRSPETRKKISDAAKRRVWIKNEVSGEILRIDKYDFPLYESKGFTRGRKIKF